MALVEELPSAENHHFIGICIEIRGRANAHVIGPVFAWTGANLQPKKSRNVPADVIMRLRRASHSIHLAIPVFTSEFGLAFYRQILLGG